jgi:Tfp pilus assembly protein PilV
VGRKKLKIAILLLALVLLAAIALVVTEMRQTQEAIARENVSRAAAINQGLSRLPMGEFDKPARWNK